MRHFILIFLSAPCFAQTVREYASPDGKTTAIISTNRTGESRTESKSMPAGQVLLIHDQTSPDGAHGYGVVQAAWTADSVFFVAGTEASGGHQSWAHPIWIYSRDRNRIFELEKSGVTATTTFTLGAADTLRVRVSGCNGGPERAITIRLPDFSMNARIRGVACPPAK